MKFAVIELFGNKLVPITDKLGYMKEFKTNREALEYGIENCDFEYRVIEIWE